MMKKQPKEKVLATYTSDESLKYGVCVCVYVYLTNEKKTYITQQKNKLKLKQAFQKTISSQLIYEMMLHFMSLEK